MNKQSSTEIRHTTQCDTVFLLHGIAMNRWCMSVLAKYLRHDGYRAIAVSYPSTRHSLDDLARWFYERHLKDSLEQLSGSESKIHFVTHSLGGLLINRFFALYADILPDTLIGRTVMLGPPHLGSEIADFLATTKPLDRAYAAFYGPAGAELTTHGREEKASGASHTCSEIGIIAGTSAWHNPLSSHFIPTQNDGCVAVERTKLPFMKDHICIKTTHTFMLYRPVVAYQTCYFLRNGVFDHTR